MDKKFRCIAAGIICVFSFILICSNPVSAGEITITGMINDTYQIVADNGTVYEVADTDMGNDLLNNVGKTVEVMGEVVEEEGVKVINVKSYKILEKTES
ncbi:MAG: hypothetical protein OEV45_02295 [Desulfobacteraceae bacterium]|nr:hypothetical protein [Desulfobacteraceae bacterium]